MSEKSHTLSRDQKGRIGEDVVCLGFRQLGYSVHRTGIEHTDLLTLQRSKSIYSNPMFQQKRKSPDFLLSKGEDSFFIEVKLRTNANAKNHPGFLGDLMTTYLGTLQQEPLGGDKLKRGPRLAYQYFSMYKDVCILLLTPEGAHLARLGDLFYASQEGSGLSDGWESAWEQVIENKWGGISREFGFTKDKKARKHLCCRLRSFQRLGEDWKRFAAYYESVRHSLCIEDWDRVQISSKGDQTSPSTSQRSRRA